MPIKVMPVRASPASPISVGLAWRDNRAREEHPRRPFFCPLLIEINRVLRFWHYKFRAILNGQFCR
jgi:hypothetical protein